MQQGQLRAGQQQFQLTFSLEVRAAASPRAAPSSPARVQSHFTHPTQGSETWQGTHPASNPEPHLPELPILVQGKDRLSLLPA